VAKANEAKLSMIKLTHNIWIEVKGDSLMTTPPKKAKAQATTLMVN